MSEFDGIVIRPCWVVQDNDTPDRTERGGLAIKQAEKDKLSIAGNMVAVREIINTRASSPELQDLGKVNWGMLYDRFSPRAIEWHRESPIDGAGTKLTTDLRNLGSCRGSRRVRFDGTNLFGRFGIVFDFTIQKSRIVKEEIFFLASPEDAWDNAHKDLVAVYEAKAKKLAEQKKPTLAITSGPQDSQGLASGSTLGARFRTVMKAIDFGKAK